MRPTRKLKVGMVVGPLLVQVPILAVALLLPGCPRPMPDPNGPDATGGTGGSTPAPLISCDDAARHAEEVCSGAGDAISATCENQDQSYLARVMKASDCDGVDLGDPVDPNTGQLSTHGR